MSRTRPRAIGEFCWLSADIGVECLSCGRVAVYCDWEASACFRERGWSTAVADAIRRYRWHYRAAWGWERLWIQVRMEPS